MVAAVVFCPDSRLVLSHHVVSFETASWDTQTLNLSRKVSKLYANRVRKITGVLISFLKYKYCIETNEISVIFIPRICWFYGNCWVIILWTCWHYRSYILTRKQREISEFFYVTPIKPRSHRSTATFYLRIIRFTLLFTCLLSFF